MAKEPPATTAPPAPPGDTPSPSPDGTRPPGEALGSATYEIIRQRLHTQGATLRERMNLLDARRQEVFGAIEFKLLQADRIAQTTFYRFIREHDLLAPEDKDNKKRLAFSMKHANQLWQADTMFGPYVDTGLSTGSRKQAKLIAFPATRSGAYA